jgi:hypothetical protein
MKILKVILDEMAINSITYNDAMPKIGTLKVVNDFDLLWYTFLPSVYSTTTYREED